MSNGGTQNRAAGTGSALLVTLIFVALFACMAVALAVASESNLAISRNRLDVGQAHNLVETGLCLVQRESASQNLSGSDAAALHASRADHFRFARADTRMRDANGIVSDASGVTFPAVSVLGPDGRTGTVTVSMTADGGVQDSPTITVTANGQFAGATRTAYYDFHVRSGYRILSDYGLASQAPISLTGASKVDGANNDNEASLFSCSESDTYGIDMGGTSEITGHAAVSGENVGINKSGNATIGGDEITDAPDHDWPVADPTHFEQYVESTYDGDGDEQDATFSNIRIPAGTNPTFSNVNLYGLVYIESPNTVTFNGNANICGIVVCEEPTVENFDNNKLTFNGNLTASGVEYLPDDPRYDGIRKETGTFLLAPGFFAKFSGNSSMINGYIAAGKLEFTGGASGTVRGGVLNLSDTSLTLAGGAHLTIDKENADQQPAGFTRRYSLICVSGSYRE